LFCTQPLPPQFAPAIDVCLAVVLDKSSIATQPTDAANTLVGLTTSVPTAELLLQRGFLRTLEQWISRPPVNPTVADSLLRVLLRICQYETSSTLGLVRSSLSPILRVWITHSCGSPHPPVANAANQLHRLLPGVSGLGSSHPASASIKKHILFVTGRSATETQTSLSQKIQGFGRILNVRFFPKDPPMRGFTATVLMASEEEANAALHGMTRYNTGDNHSILVTWYKPYDERHGYRDEETGWSSFRGHFHQTPLRQYLPDRYRPCR
jgi:hypothetical protein